MIARVPDLSRIRALIIDLDGVLWRGDTLLPGVGPFFEHLRHTDRRFVLATNNATAAPAEIRARLQPAGVQVSDDEILTSALAAAAYLAEDMAGTAVLMIGDDGLRQALLDQGFSLVDRAEQAEAVVVGMNRDLTWRDLAEANLALGRGVRFIGTNPDVTFPVERGLVPGNGATLAALQTASGRTPEVVGKPEPHLYRQATRRLGAEPVNTLIVGDRLETDILGGQRLGAPTALLFTGVTKPEDINGHEIQPDHTFEGLPQLLAALGGK